MIRVIALLPHDQAIVSTKGLYRMLITPDDRIVDEMVEEGTAFIGVNTFNRCCTSSRQVALSYKDIYEQAAYNADHDGQMPLAQHGPRVLAIVDGCLVVETDGLRRVVVQPGNEKLPAETLAELVPKKRAKAMVREFNRSGRPRWASSVKYDDLAPPAPSDEPSDSDSPSRQPEPAEVA